MRFRRALGVRLFSQREYHSPVLEFLVLWSYSIDGLSLHSLQVDIIIRGSCLVQIRNRQKIPPWPGDFKRWMRVIHEELETWCIIIGLYFWWFMSYRQLLLILFILKAFLHDPVVLMIKNKIQRSEWGSVRFKTRSLKISQQQNAGVLGTDCDVSDGSYPMIFLEKENIYSQELRAKRKIFKTKNKVKEI
ncbi:hypothetical protein Bca4012_001829 [Brassica carinata]|uniref:Uncharacterized protein n=1 Tax=Brassica carinata TaxID=52824 RepID=A0A8X7UZN5_BRACI|nr:hypothetical protein Bca52824_043353 [Brassica carinata]